MELTRPEVSQSTFVTVLAWIFIVLAGFATLISLLQNVIINTVFPVDELQRASHSSASNDAPAAAMFLASHVKWFFAAFLVVTASTLVAAVGLLRRRNWARLAFIAILLLGISWNVVALVAQQFFFASMPVVPPDAPPHFRAESQAMEGFFMVMRVVSVVMAVGFSVLFGWLVKRLLSASIAAEFANGA